MTRNLPSIPYAEFPLRPHRNGQWYKSVWNPRTRRSEQVYFGNWKSDPTGERALHDPISGWLARRSAIKAGTDCLRVTAQGSDEQQLTLGELMRRFLQHNKLKVDAGDLSIRTLGDYIRETRKFVEFFGTGMVVSGLGPAHFSVFMRHLVEDRKLGRYARRRVRVYINVMLGFGAKNGWFTIPAKGADWIAPATDAAAIRQAKLRAGEPDYSDRILSGDELTRLLQHATPAWKAILLVAVNCGFGPADIGRLRWKHINMTTGHVNFPRLKTGQQREGYLWKQTRRALEACAKLKRHRKAIERDGKDAFVFLSEDGNPMYREAPRVREVEVDGRRERKVVGVTCENAVSITFRRYVRELELPPGLTFYRLRHTFKTLAKASRDRDAIDLMMGHADNSIGKRYDHEVITIARLKRVAVAVKRQLWPRGALVKPKVSRRRPCAFVAPASAEQAGQAKARPSVRPSHAKQCR